jgi:hypothetical protein
MDGDGDGPVHAIPPRCRALFLAWYACEKNAEKKQARPFGCWLPRRVYEACERVAGVWGGMRVGDEG